MSLDEPLWRVSGPLDEGSLGRRGRSPQAPEGRKTTTRQSNAGPRSPLSHPSRARKGQVTLKISECDGPPLALDLVRSIYAALERGDTGPWRGGETGGALTTNTQSSNDTGGTPSSGN